MAYQSGARPFPKRHGGGDKPAIEVPAFHDKEMLGKKAEVLARALAERTGLTTHQLRRFYNEVKNIERGLMAGSDRGASWDKAYPRIKLLKAKAYYNASRKQNRLPGQFKEFIGTCIDRIPCSADEGLATFTQFSQLFEAVVGYSRAYTRD